MPGTGYALTESGGVGIGLRGAHYVNNPAATGRLQGPLLQMRIIDDADKDVSIGEVGELLLKSPSNMRCYLNKPVETAEALRDGWLYTGDLAREDGDGIITIVDRKKDMIIRGGENISATEVQVALYRHPSVVEATVFSVPDDRLGEEVAACVYVKSDTVLTEFELREFLSKDLAHFKVPKRIWFKNNPLPRVGSEKIDKLILQKECTSFLTNSANC